MRIVSQQTNQASKHGRIEARPRVKPRFTSVRAVPPKQGLPKAQLPQGESPLVLDAKRRAERFGHLRHEGREQSRTAQMKAMIRSNPYYAQLAAMQRKD